MNEQLHTLLNDYLESNVFSDYAVALKEMNYTWGEVTEVIDELIEERGLSAQCISNLLELFKG